MRNKAYRYYQNKKHGYDRYPHNKHRRGGRWRKTNYKKSWDRYSKNIVWSNHDLRQMVDIRDQIKEENGDKTISRNIDGYGKRIPRIL